MIFARYLHEKKQNNKTFAAELKLRGEFGLTDRGATMYTKNCIIY